MTKYDITFCASHCENKKCFRHKSKVKEISDSISWSDFSVSCDAYKKDKKWKLS